MSEEITPQAKENNQKGIPGWLLALIIVVIIAIAAVLFIFRGIIVQGTITDAVTGAPVKGASVSIGSIVATSDENGKFKLRLSKLEGELVVNANGYEPLSLPVEKNPVISLVPLPETVANYWFNYWKDGNYDKMYELLADDCRQAITKEAFADEFSRYKLEITGVRTQRAGGEGDSADVKADVDINTPFGKQTLQFTITLKKEGGIWKIVWYSGSTGMASGFVA